jgi:phage/plasmid primase-like uncharacterized protein
VQSIQENGMKRFATGGAKQDMFHVVGGQGLEWQLSRAENSVKCEPLPIFNTNPLFFGRKSLAV